jgi:hypothetical protein
VALTPVVRAAGTGSEFACDVLFSDRYAPQRERTGQSPQRGVCGVHTVAPSSIMAWLKSPGRLGSTSSCAIFSNGEIALEDIQTSQQNAFISLLLGSPLIRRSRASTRMTFPSTTGVASPYLATRVNPDKFAGGGGAHAMLATAPAVYLPMPGRSSSCLAERGSWPA